MKTAEDLIKEGETAVDSIQWPPTDDECAKIAYWILQNWSDIRTHLLQSSQSFSTEEVSTLVDYLGEKRSR